MILNEIQIDDLFKTTGANLKKYEKSIKALKRIADNHSDLQHLEIRKKL